MPGNDGPDGSRAGQGLVFRGAEVDRAPGEDPEIDRLVDGEVVGTIRDVAEQEHDQDEPEGRLDRGPAPAPGVEQAEQCPAAGLYRSRLERLLRHRPPTSLGLPSAAGESAT